MKVSELFVHPIKSFRGVSVPEIEVTDHGVHLDRIYMVTLPSDEPGKLKWLTQREYGLMALLEPEIVDGHILARHRDGGVALRLPTGQHLAEIASKCPIYKVDIWGDDAEVYDVGEITGFKQWWKTVCEDPKFSDASIVVHTPTGHRPLGDWVAREHQEPLGRAATNNFQDVYPGHLVGTASLAELNERLARESKGQAKPVTCRNFRPNIVVDTEEPYEEDFWELFKVGDVTWYNDLLCPRCPIPGVDPKTGIHAKQSLHPAKTLRKYRLLEEKFKPMPCFGICLTNKNTWGKIRIGDEIQVMELGSRY